MPNLVDRPRLNALRFPENPLTPGRFTRLCSRAEIPGAVKLGDRWMVDLETFDAAVVRAISAPAAHNSANDDDFAARVRRAREEAYASAPKAR